MRIVSWNVNGLYTTLKDAGSRYASVSNYFSEVLKADIVCFQEAKIQEEKLEKWMACVPGYDSHWAFSQVKKGYSGVVNYVKQEFTPVDAKADWLGENSHLTEDLCNEGRLICTDHGSFVLLNVYVPNAGDHEEGRPRLDFKLRYLEALEQTCDELVRTGRHFVVVGDFNVAHKDIDVHSKWKVEECYSLEEREWMDGFFSKYVDLYRHFHPDTTDVFSVWNQKTEARIHNEGLRIDYAICDKGFLSQVMEADIVKMVPKNWSDHASVMVLLKEQPSLAPHEAPALSSRNMKQFNEDPRQKKLTALFSKGFKPQASTAPQETKVAEAKVSMEISQIITSAENLPSSTQEEQKESSLHVMDEGSPLIVSSTQEKLVESSISHSGEAGPTTDIKHEDILKPEIGEELKISGSKLSAETKKSVVQSKAKGKSVDGKRKAEQESPAKGSGNKQRNLNSFFKPSNTK